MFKENLGDLLKLQISKQVLTKEIERQLFKFLVDLKLKPSDNGFWA